MSPGSHPFDLLPRVDPIHVGLQSRLTSGQPERLLNAWRGLPLDPKSIKLGPPEILRRASGIHRAGLTVQLICPGLSTRIGLGVEATLAHALVDTMLGHHRPESEQLRQVTPVEWGILTDLVARLVWAWNHSDSPGDAGFHLMIDRVGPEPFDAANLGPVMTIRWPVHVGEHLGSARLWVAESLVQQILIRPPTLVAEPPSHRFDELATIWRAEAGTSTFPRGLARLRVGGVAPIDGSPLGGTPASPTGRVRLTVTDCDGRSTIETEPAPRSAGSRLIVTATVHRDILPREPVAVNPSPSESPPMTPTPTTSPADVPVTLVVELGRINMPLRRLADLKPGDVIEVGRHAREPVELTSNGRLVARGELVQIDTELGVRITSVFL